MNWNGARAWAGTLARLVLGVTLIWASLSKIESPRKFVQTVRVYDVTWEWLSKFIGYGMPVLMVCLGLLLLTGVMVRVAAAVSGVLFLLFTIGLIEVAARGIKVQAGVLGNGGPTTGSTNYAWLILLNLAFLAIAGFLFWWSVTPLSYEAFLARHDYVEEPSAKRMRSDQGRRKYEAQVAAKLKEARERSVYLRTSLVVVVVLVSLVGIGVQAGRAKIPGKVASTHASVYHGVTYGEKAAATVDVYEDFGSAASRKFEQTVNATLTKDVKADLAQVRYHPVSMLDRISPNDYSTRSANAALCASDLTADAFKAYHDILFGKNKAGTVVQPAMGKAGPDSKGLVSLGTDSGMTADERSTFSQCITAKSHYQLVAALTEQASRKGFSETPRVVVNGAALNSNDLKTLKAAIAAADKKGPAPTPSPVSTAPTATAANPSSSGASSAAVSTAAASPTVTPTPSPTP